jgi:hypothetical protein
VKKVIVNAFPKSGVTWLLHLVCDLLEAQHQDTPQMEPLSYGHPVSGEWVVKKTHYPYWEQAIPYLKGKTVVLTQRDPRDIAVSAMFYRKAPDLDKAIDVMIKSDYVGWMESWLKPVDDIKVKKMIFTCYEDLHFNPIPVLRGIVDELTGKWLSDSRIELALDRQSFPNMVTQLGGDRHLMRKGIVGDWRNHFNQEQAERFNDHFGQFMIEQCYVDDLEWWKDV